VWRTVYRTAKPSYTVYRTTETENREGMVGKDKFWCYSAVKQQQLILPLLLLLLLLQLYKGIASKLIFSGIIPSLTVLSFCSSGRSHQNNHCILLNEFRCQNPILKVSSDTAVEKQVCCQSAQRPSNNQHCNYSTVERLTATVTEKLTMMMMMMIMQWKTDVLMLW